VIDNEVQTSKSVQTELSHRASRHESYNVRVKNTTNSIVFPNWTKVHPSIYFSCSI